MSDDALKKWKAIASGWMGLVAVVFGGVTLVALMVHYVKHGVTSSLSGLAPFVTSIAWPGVGFTCAWLLLRDGTIVGALVDAIGRVRKAGPVELADTVAALGLEPQGRAASGDSAEKPVFATSRPGHDGQVWAAYYFGVVALNPIGHEHTPASWNKARTRISRSLRTTMEVLHIPIDTRTAKDLLNVLDHEITTDKQAKLAYERLVAFGSIVTSVLRERLDSSWR